MQLLHHADLKSQTLNKISAAHDLISSHQTLLQSCSQHGNSDMTKEKDQSTDQKCNSNPNMKLKFNTCYDNLRCFISTPKGEKFRSVSARLSKQYRSEVCLSNFKLQIQHLGDQKCQQVPKSQTERHSSDIAYKNQQLDESDLSKILSNQIIHEIQRKGIRYNWSNIEQIKSESYSADNRQEEAELAELFNTFSDKKNTRYSFQQNKSTLSQSLITEDSVVQNMEEKDILLNRGEQASTYHKGMYLNFQDQAHSFNQNFDNKYDKNYSFASTIDQYSNVYYPMQMYTAHDMNGMISQGLKSMPSSMFHSHEFIIRPEGLGYDPRTTIMIKNIPNKYTIQFLSEEIDRQFGNYYDFLYLPCDTKSGANQGYGFINFVDLDAIKRFYEQFHGKKWRRFRSQKICNLTYARLQGINSLIEHFQNSKVLNHKEKKYQPIIRKLNQQINDLIKEQQSVHHSYQGGEKSSK